MISWRVRDNIINQNLKDDSSNNNNCIYAASYNYLDVRVYSEALQT